MQPVLYAILGMIGAFVLAGLAYLAVMIIGTIRNLKQAVEAAAEATKAIAPLLKSEEFVRFSNAFILMGKQGADMLIKMEALNQTIGLFYKFAVSQNQVMTDARPGSTVAPGGGGFVGYSDERAAAREAASRPPEEVLE